MTMSKNSKLTTRCCRMGTFRALHDMRADLFTVPPSSQHTTHLFARHELDKQNEHESRAPRVKFIFFEEIIHFIWS